MSKGSDRVRVQHMHDAARKALEFAKGRAREDLDEDDLFTFALIHAVEILGEAAKNLSPEARALAPGVDWKAIAGTRDRLAHRYFDVDLGILWEIASRDLPALLLQLEALLAKLPE
ncbi:MAG: HepT-like ribonuclease domain-containing protein [Bdellovibrionota bacterium]